MYRRSFLVSLIAATTALAGCSTASDEDEPTPTPSPTTEQLPVITVSAVDLSPSEPDIELSAGWRARVQHRFAPADEDEYTIADDDRKWVVVQCEVTAENGPVDIHRSWFQLEVDGTPLEVVSSGSGEHALEELSLEEGETASRYLLFDAPREVEEGSLVAVQDRSEQTLAVSWEQDSSLEFGAKK